MGVIVRTEPTGNKFLEGYPQTMELLQKVQWLKFIEKFDGFHKEVMNTFARSFHGMKVEICDVKFAITESLIAEATKLPRNGEKWFKNRGIKGEYWKIFLKKPNMDTTIFRKGIPSLALKIKWRNLLLVLESKIYYL